jgi:UDP-4-amino-4,6-dideoxy-N-acetyl-beta-L-altrosamine transaminase
MIEAKNKFIPYGRHYIDQSDIDAVTSVLKDGMLTQGPKIDEFEKCIAKKVKAKYAIAVSSASAALHLACIALKIDSSDACITSVNTFVASANCFEYLGAKTLLCDIEKDSLNMCPDDLENKISEYTSIKLIVPVHFSGVASNMEQISDIAKKNNAYIVEDASHALGGYYSNGEPVGSCIYSDMTIFSLHPVKGVTAGEGGVITTNNKEIARALKQLRSHGICKGNFDLPGISVGDDTIINKSEALENGKLNPWYYEMQTLGYNYRITDIQCALAISQLMKLEQFVDRKKEISSRYDLFFNERENIQLTQEKFRDISAHHLYVLRINFKKLKISRQTLMNKLFLEGIGTQVHYIPIPIHPYYANKGFLLSDYPNMQNYYDEALSIPLYYGLSDDLVREVCDKISDNLYK